MGVTTIYALPYPEAADSADVPTDMHELCDRLEVVLPTVAPAPTLIGPYASRPAATSVRPGTLYCSSDALGVWRSDGTAWTLVSQGEPQIAPAALSNPPWSTPYDGMVVRLLVDAANGVGWTVRYNAGSSSAYKWEFVGGPPVAVSGPGGQNTVDSTFQHPAGSPAITVARAGDYRADFSGNVLMTSVAGNVQLSAGVGGALEPSAIFHLSNPAGQANASIGKSVLVAGAAAGAVINWYMQTVGGPSNFSVDRATLSVIPIRVS